MIRVPDPCLLVLVGAPGAGKSHWANEWFRPEQVVSSDGLRAVVGLGERDQRASKDAFAVLNLIVERRLKRKLTTVIDSTALESEHRQSYITAARKAGVPVFAIVFDTSDDVCRARNRERDRPVPPKVLKGQLQAATALDETIGDEGFDGTHTAGPITVVLSEFVHAAAFAAKLRLGTLVTGITYRNIAHLAKIVATLDVVSGGRAFCGLGAAWFKREHDLYGWEFPPVSRRYEMLEDALQLLPLMWGPGSPAFEGKTISVQEAICYPRPMQERIPILVGGSGERRTLKLVAQYADACNLFGDAETVRQKIDVLHKHCATLERDPSEITVTQLSTVGDHPVDDQIGRYRELAEAGVQEAIVSLDEVAAIEQFAPVIDAFRSGG